MAPSSTARKQLGLLDAAMIIMGSMIGSGIFLAPALIAGIAVESQLSAGSFVLVWVVGGLLTLCAALSFGELASSLPRTGGQYIYLSEAFTPFWGFLYGWTLFTVIQCGFIAAVAVAFANYLGVFLPWVSQSHAVLAAGSLRISSVQIVAILLVATLSWVNSRGLTAGVLTAFAVAMSKALFAYDSWNVITFVAEETRDPVRTLPRALFLGTLGVTLIYTLATSAYLYILPIGQAAQVPDQRIAAEVARIGSGGLQPDCPGGARLHGRL